MDNTSMTMSASESVPGRSFRKVLRDVFSFPVFLGAALSAGAVAATLWEKAPLVAGTLFVEGDTWWHVAVGERILSTHTWPSVDIYSFTALGAPWIAYEWLGEVAMAAAARLGGLHGLAVLLVSLCVAFVLLTYYYAWLVSGHHLAAAVAAALVTPVARACFTMRPQMIAYCFLLLTLICLERFRQGCAHCLWALPAIVLAWVNTHSSFLFGLFVLGLYWAAGLFRFRCGFLRAERWTPPQRRRLLFVSLLSLLATLLTPYGTQLAAHPVKYAFGAPYITRVFTEWQALDFSAPFARWFLALLLLALVCQVVSPVVYRLEILALLVVAVVESCLHARFLIIFASVYAPVLATLAARHLPAYRRAEDHPVVNALLVGAIAFGVAASIPSAARLDSALRCTFPVAAVQYLRQTRLPPRLFNEDTWGGFLIWSLGPEHKVFIDGRGEAYENNGVIADYLRIVGDLDAAPALLRKYRIAACLLHRGSPLAALLAVSPDWRRAYADDQSAIFVREDRTP